MSSGYTSACGGGVLPLSLVTWQTPVVRLSMQPCASDAPS
eukprot:SAG25_NODE_13800_length_262_cov_1.907975_1_plen_39_part_10